MIKKPKRRSRREPLTPVKNPGQGLRNEYCNGPCMDSSGAAPWMGPLVSCTWDLSLYLCLALTVKSNGKPIRSAERKGGLTHVYQQLALAPALALGAAAAAVVALAVPAGASTGTRWISPEQAGYIATGAQFKTVSTHVYLRNPAQYAGKVASYRHSVQLWSSGLVVTVDVRPARQATVTPPMPRSTTAAPIR